MTRVEYQGQVMEDDIWRLEWQENVDGGEDEVVED
jgi:hypothetical protein